ncbi:polyphosphate polymerase domain-containing protein [Aeromicrobium sp.]|uniref:polyphosphate polymerase domain-containing protein n=1 Tax=Aeromicrobium sp. TaxID=1871063 RepID=UPI003C327BBC
MTDTYQTTGAPLRLSGLRTVSLDDVVESAALMRRVDRKYLVPAATADALIDALAHSHAALQIAGRASTTYRSTYFDTPTFASTRHHIQGRRRRWKIRSRWYVEDDLCRVEVKTKNGRGETIKVAGPSSPERYGRLDGAELAFVESVLAETHPELSPSDLVPSAEVTYTRATLADLSAGTRVTIDWGVVASLAVGSAWIDDDFVLIETKGRALPARADRVLTSLGARPRSFSKYAAATSLLHDDIADNDIRDIRGRLLHCHSHSTQGLR